MWWTSTHKHEDMQTLRVGSRGRTWDLPFSENFDVLGYRFHRDGKSFQGAERDKHIYRAKTVLLKNKCERVHSHVYSTVLNGSINSPWSGAMITKVRAWEFQMLRLTFRPRMRLDEGRLPNQNITVHEDLLEEDGPAAADGENCE